MNLLTDARKLLVALSGAAAEAVSLGLLSGTAEKWVTGVLAALTAALVYLVPNSTTPPPAAPVQPAKPADAGLTVIELLVTAVLLVVLFVLLAWLVRR